MRKKKILKILGAVLMTLLIVGMFAINSFAAIDIELADGSVVTVPNVVPGKVIYDDAAFVFDNKTYTNVQYPITSGYYFTSLEVANFHDNKPFAFGLKSSAGDTWSSTDFCQWELPIKSSGSYSIKFDVIFMNANKYTENPLPGQFFLHVQQDAAQSCRIVTVDSDSVGLQGLMGYRFYDQDPYTNLPRYVFKTSINFDFDTKIITTYITDVNGKSISFENDMSAFTVDYGCIKLRYGHTPDTFINKDFSAVSFTNFSLSTGDVILSDSQLESFRSYFKEVSERQYSFGYSDSNSISTKYIAQLKEEYNTLLDRFNDAKEGLENNQAVGALINGMYISFESFMNTIFELDFYGFTIRELFGIFVILALLFILVRIVIKALQSA